MAAINDLQLLVSKMNPTLNPGEYVYCTIPDPSILNTENVLFTFKEEEGLSVILKKEDADELGIEYNFIASWITLTVHSALDAVGLTAAFSNALSDAGISCNIVAATFHDHIFVNRKDSEKALTVLNNLQQNSGILEANNLQQSSSISVQNDLQHSSGIVDHNDLQNNLPLQTNIENPEVSIPPKTYCVTCGTELIDKHCHHCGEKVVSSKDFTFSKLLEQGIDIFTHLDSKLFKSLKGLLFQPGSLAVTYIKGVRKPYMKPFQVFLLSNILFFFFLSSADIFLVPSKWFFTDYYPGMTKIAKDVMVQKKLSLQEVALLYDTKVASNSKLFVVVIIPFISLGTWIFGFRQHKEFGKHVVHALFFLSFTMVFAAAISQIPKPILESVPEISLRISTTILVLVYVYFSLRNFLSQSIMLRIANTLVFTAIFLSILLAYRYIISWSTLKFFL